LVKMIPLGNPILLGLFGVSTVFTINILVGLGIVASIIGKSSDKFLSSCRQLGTRWAKVERRMLAGRKDFCVRVLNSYSVDKLAPLTILDIAITTMMTILIAFPHKLV